MLSAIARLGLRGWATPVFKHRGGVVPRPLRSTSARLSSANGRLGLKRTGKRLRYIPYRVTYVPKARGLLILRVPSNEEVAPLKANVGHSLCLEGLMAFWRISKQ